MSLKKSSSSLTLDGGRLPSSSTCPFCRITSASPPVRPSASSSLSSQSDSGPKSGSPGHAHLILSTKHVLAFLNIMPLARGHVLLTTRGHWEKVGDVGVRIGEELGKWLPIMSRVVTRTLLGKDSEEEAHWNIVQNNGVRAAQVVPHVHFHIIPRLPPSTETTALSSANPTAVATSKSQSWTMFGRGQREELDEEEGEQLASAMREELAREVRRVKEKEGVDLDFDLDNKNHRDDVDSRVRNSERL